MIVSKHWLLCRQENWLKKHRKFVELMMHLNIREMVTAGGDFRVHQILSERPQVIFFLKYI